MKGNNEIKSIKIPCNGFLLETFYQISSTILKFMFPKCTTIPGYIKFVLIYREPFVPQNKNTIGGLFIRL